MINWCIFTFCISGTNGFKFSKLNVCKDLEEESASKTRLINIAQFCAVNASLADTQCANYVEDLPPFILAPPPPTPPGSPMAIIIVKELRRFHFLPPVYIGWKSNMWPCVCVCPVSKVSTGGASAVCTCPLNSKSPRVLDTAHTHTPLETAQYKHTDTRGHF